MTSRERARAVVHPNILDPMECIRMEVEVAAAIDTAVEEAVHGHCQTIDELNHEVVMLMERVTALEAALRPFTMMYHTEGDVQRAAALLRKDAP